MAAIKHHQAVEKAQKAYHHHNGLFEKGVIGYFTSAGAPTEKIPQIIKGVIRVYRGEDVATLFSPAHHGRVRIFAMQYATVEKMEIALQNAQDELAARLDADARDLHEV